MARANSDCVVEHCGGARTPSTNAEMRAERLTPNQARSMYRNALIVTIVMLSQIGCSSSNPIDISTGTIIGSAGNLSIDYMGLNDKIVFMVWSDVVGSSKSNSTSSDDTVTLWAESESKNGRKLLWKCVASADGAGTLILDDNQYDLSDGSIILVSTRDGSLHVRQVSREVIATSDVHQRIRELTEDDEIVSFFADESPESVDRPIGPEPTE